MSLGVFNRSPQVELIGLKRQAIGGDLNSSIAIGRGRIEDDFFVDQQFVMEGQVVAVWIEAIVRKRLNLQAVALALVNLLARKQHGDVNGSEKCEPWSIQSKKADRIDVGSRVVGAGSSPLNPVWAHCRKRFARRQSFPLPRFALAGLYYGYRCSSVSRVDRDRGCGPGAGTGSWFATPKLASSQICDSPQGGWPLSVSDAFAGRNQPAHTKTWNSIMMQETSPNPYAVGAPQVAAYAADSERLTFIQRTYAHMTGAIVALIAVEAVLFQVVPAATMDMLVTRMLSGFGWLIVLGAFMAVSWVARAWATNGGSLSVQYLSLIHISEPTRRTIPSRMPSTA